MLILAPQCGALNPLAMPSHMLAWARAFLLCGLFFSRTISLHLCFIRRAASFPGASLWGPGSLSRYAPQPSTLDAGPRRSPRRTCRAYPHAHLGLVGLEQLPAHADRRLVAHVGVAQQQHSWVRACAWAWGSGGLTSPQLPRLPALRCALGLSRARLFLFVQHGKHGVQEMKRPSWGSLLGVCRRTSVVVVLTLEEVH